MNTIFKRTFIVLLCTLLTFTNAQADVDNYNEVTMGEKVYLETANWGQNSPFNKQIFTSSGGSTNAKAGCVPTAYAIVMRYHGFPTEGTTKPLYNCQSGVEITDRVYDFSKMPLTNGSNWTEEQEAEVAKFFSHVLHACFPSKIGTGSTEVNEGSNSKVLNDYFNYQLINASYQANFTMEQWIEKIKESIDNGCPIPYASDNSGTGDTRHMFVLDGYTTNNYFHFNFGWNGSGNGWFKLDAITPSQGDNYSWINGAEHYALFNLAPNKTMRTVTASVNDSNMGTVSINGGTVGITASAEINEDFTATLTAYPAQGYALANWTKNGVIVGTKNTLKVKVGASDNDYVANFDDEANVLVEKDCKFTITDVTKSGINGNYCSTWTTNDGIVLSCTKGSEAAYALSTSVNTFFAKAAVVSNSETLVTDITYTLTAPAGYIIKSYSFKGKSPSSSYTIDVTVGGNTTNVTNASAGVVISASDINAQSTSFVLSSTYAGRAGLAIMDGVTVTIQSEGGGSTPTPTTYAITTAANPAEGGTAKFAVGTGSQQTQGDVNNGEKITLYATANTGYNFVNWTLNGTEVSTDAICNVTASQAANYVANFEPEAAAEQFPDGAYKIYWQADNRGYLAYHATDYPNEAKLAGVTYSGCQNIHYAVNEVDLVWYLITADDGKRYLFQAATGKFLGVDTSIQANGTGNKLSTTEAWPIAIEENTHSTRLGHYIITTKINDTNSLLCSGCGTPKEQHPVRWLTVNDENQKDGGAPLQLIPVNDVTVADNVMNTVLAVINGTDEPEQPTDPLAGKYFRLKVKNTTNYMNIANTSNNTGSTSGVTVVAKNESSDTQIFLFEQSGDGYKLKANSSNYIKCHDWNANANTTDAGEATVLTFEPTGNELEYLIKWDNKTTNNGVEREDYFKVENNYVYCDAASTAATVWVLEEVIPSNEKTLTVTYSGATWNNATGSWWVSVVTNTTPAVTVRTTDGTPKIGFSTFNEVRHPYLLDGNSFTISVPANCKITGYRLGYQAHNLVSKSVTYTNGKESTGTVTIAQSDEQNTLTVTGLDNNEISFSVEDQTTQGGFIIKSLEITYVENEFEPAMFKAEIEGWRDNNPNTHLGTITIGGTTMKLTPAHQTASELTMPVVEGTTLAFTRKYRGFEFNGFYIGSTSLGENPTLTADNVAAIDENNPLIAKFTATDDVTLFYDDDTYSYRIPAIAKTGTNRLVAVSDYRHSHDDIGRDNHGTGTNRVDLVMRTSDDNGATWSAKQAIAEGTSTFGYGDAAIVANGQDILVMAVAGNVFYPNANATNKNKTYRIYSNNNGQSWTKEEVTSNIFGLFDEAYATFFGSGKLAVDPNFNGTGKARVYGAILLKNSARSTNNYVLFSDDWGATWNILGGSKTQIAEADEPKVEILPNGQILLSSRHASGGSRVFNVFTYGNDKAAGEGTWGTAVSGCSNGGSNGTNGEIICLDAKQTNGKPTKILLQSQPQGGSSTWDRKDVTIWYKEIGNETQTPSSIASGWTMGKQVSTVQSAYSAMALQENGEIAFFFEEAPCHNDDNTYGYSMVYVPLTIEEITENNFLNPNADVEYVPTEFNIVLTDAQDNEYRETLDYIPGDVAAVESYLTTTYPFITLGTTGAIADNKYTNTVTLPFKVSNANTTVWHNIYFPANGTSAGEYYPIYLMAENENATAVAKITEKVHYGNSQYNTYNYADKLAWAVYNVNEGFTFKFKNKLTGKFMAVTGVSSDNTNNVVYTDEAGATAFTLEKYTGGNASYGNYAIKSVYNSTTGYVCNTSVGYTYATNYPGTGHAGAWAKIVESPDYWTIYEQLITDINNFGDGDGKYTANNTISSIDVDALASMIFSDLTAQATAVQTVKDSYREITLTVPEVNDAVPGTVSIAGEPVNNKFVPGNTEIELIATAKAGYVFKNWTRTVPQATVATRTGVARETEVVSTDNPYRVTVSDALSLTANFEQIAMAAMTAILTDEEGNTYRHQFNELPGDAAAIKAALEAAYPFIKLGDNPAIEDNTYTNTVTLPFKVSNATNTYWHNIYWPANGTSPGEFYPIYLSANAATDTYVTKATEKKHYGESQYNTLAYAEKLSWAVYSVDNTLNFKFKNKLTGKYIKVTSVATADTQNVEYSDEENATAFTLTKNTDANYKGDYAITSVLDGQTGYVCNTAVGYANATNYYDTGHNGAWAKFVEAYDYMSAVSNLNYALDIWFQAGEDDRRVITPEIDNVIKALEADFGDYTLDGTAYQMNGAKTTLNNIKAYAAIVDETHSWPTLALTITPEGSGNVTINGENVKSKKAPVGYTLNIGAVANNGYEFQKWANGTSTVSTNANSTFTMPQGGATLTANFNEVVIPPTTYTISVEANPATAGSATVAANATSAGASSLDVTAGGSAILTAVANDGYVFTNWTKNGQVVSTDANCTINNISASANYVANFEKDDAGGGTTGKTGYIVSEEFGALTDNGSSKKEEWVFNNEKDPAYPAQLRLNANEAAISVNGTQYRLYGDEDGTTYTLSVPNDYRIVGYEITYQQRLNSYPAAINGSSTSPWVVEGLNTTSTSFTVTGTLGMSAILVTEFIVYIASENCTVSVEVNNIEYGTATVATSATSPGASSVLVNNGGSVILSAEANDGYVFTSWTKNGQVVSTDASCTIDNITEDVTFIANFKPATHTVRVSYFYANNGGTATVNGGSYANVEDGGSVLLEAIANPGYELTGWLKDGVLVKNYNEEIGDFEVQGSPFELYNITYEAEYVAVFSKKTEYTNLEDGKAYRIVATDGNGNKRYIYRNGTELMWKTTEDNTINSIFVVQKKNLAINLISGLGYHGWRAANTLGAKFDAIKLTYATTDDTRTLYMDSGTSTGVFTTFANNTVGFRNSAKGFPIVANESESTNFTFVEVPDYAFQVSAADGSNAKLGTVNLPFATTVPDGVTVYGVNYTEGEQVYMAELLTDNVLPANTPVLVKAEAAGQYGFKPAPASGDTYNTGFAGTLEAEDIPGTTNAYILSYEGEGTHIMLYKLSSTSRRINANKAYYIDATGKASALKFVLGGTTDIEDMESENGEVEAIYDLQGRKLSEITEPGMYIINGKKVYKK